MADDDKDKWLADFLNEHTFTDDAQEVVDLLATKANVERLILTEFADGEPEVDVAGSYAKTTMVKDTYDLDVVSYFANDDEAAGSTLEEIYANVKKALEKEYVVREKRSALRLLRTKSGDELEDYHVDVVPGRYTSDDRADVFLHQTEGDKVRLKTNLRIHVSHIKGSGATEVIQLAKVWRHRASIDIKTFPLELAVIAALGSSKAKGLDARLRETLTCFRDTVDDLVVQDPANPHGNDLSAVFGDTQREALKNAAKLALDLEADGGWSSVLGPLEKEGARALVVGVTPTASGQMLVPIADSAHLEPLRWPVHTRGEVSLRCSYQNSRGKTVLVTSDGPPLPPDVRLAFRALTSVPAPYEVWWQVVNTGHHAREADCLRGRLFETTTNPEPLLNTEPTKFSGKHWIECFIVKDGSVSARSGKFFVPIYNPTRPFWNRLRR